MRSDEDCLEMAHPVAPQSNSFKAQAHLARRAREHLQVIERRLDMASDPRVKTLAEIKTEHLFDIVVDLSPRLNFGNTPSGQRILFGAAGGSFEGPKLSGKVLAGGGDWAVFRPDGAMILDVRLTLRTHDDALIHMSYGGRWITPPDLRSDIADPVKRTLVDPARYYFRTNPLFETGAKKYAWLNDIVCVGQGYLIEGGIAYKVSQVV
jgi:hypothetical protein